MRTKRIIADTLIYILLAVLCIIWLLPIIWLFLQSFGDYDGAALTGLKKFWPDKWTFDNYINLFNNRVLDSTVGVWRVYGDPLNPNPVNFGMTFLNTLIVAIFSCIISTLLTLFTSYAFSRCRFKSRTLMMRIILILGMFPGFISLIVFYQLAKLVGLQESLIALIIIYSGGAGMGYYVSKGFFDTISKSIDEAAMIDGANQVQIFFRIIVPLSKPIIVYTALLAFMSPWGDFMTASYLYVLHPYNGTVATVLNQMVASVQNRNTYWQQFCAAAIVIAIPITALFMFLQKYYVSGVTGGAVKG